MAVPLAKMEDKKALPQGDLTPKPGWKTTELWLNVAAFVVSTLIAMGDIPVDSIWGKCLVIASIALVSLGYSGSRAVVKREATRAQGGKQ